MSQFSDLIRDILIVLVPVVGILILRPILRHALPERTVREAGKSIPFLLRTIATFFAIIAGLVLTSGTTKVEYLRETTALEINGLAMLSLISSRLPQPVSNEALRSIESYVERLANGEFPALANGEFYPDAGLTLVDLWVTFVEFEPEDDAQRTLRTMALQELSGISEQRQIRIAGGTRRTPTETWIVLIAGSLIIIVGATLGSLGWHRVAAVFLAALTAMIALVLLAIYITDHPFEYGLSREREIYDSFLMQYEQIRDARRTTVGTTPDGS